MLEELLKEIAELKKAKELLEKCSLNMDRIDSTRYQMRLGVKWKCL